MVGWAVHALGFNEPEREFKMTRFERASKALKTAMYLLLILAVIMATVSESVAYASAYDVNFGNVTVHTGTVAKASGNVVTVDVHGTLFEFYGSGLDVGDRIWIALLKHTYLIDVFLL